MTRDRGDSPHEASQPGPAYEGPNAAEQRRRVARELNGTTSELIRGLEEHLQKLRRSGDPHAVPLIDKCEQIVREIGQQIREMDSDVG